MSTAVVEVATDTCDACDHDAHVEAFVYAEHPAWASGLAFCGHHGTEYLPRLISDGATIVDRRDLVTS